MELFTSWGKYNFWYVSSMTTYIPRALGLILTCDVSQVYKSSTWLLFLFLWFLVGVDFGNVHPLVRQLPDPTHICHLTPPTMAPRQNYMGAVFVFWWAEDIRPVRPLLIKHCPGLLRQISMTFVWVECYSQ